MQNAAMNPELSLMRRLALPLVCLALAACAPLPPKPTQPPEKRYGAAELLALQPGQFTWRATSTAGEQELREADLAKIRATLALPAGPERDAALPALFDTVALYRLEVEAAKPLLLAALPGLASRDVEVQRALLTAAHTLYAKEAEPLLWPLLPQLTATKPFAIAAYTILSARPDAADRLSRLVPAQFPQWADEPRLTHLMQRIAAAQPARPPLPELLAAPLRPGYPVLFSLQRSGRQQMGLALVRGADGRFVRDASGALFASPQLALALTNLPGSITNGNTPQGVFTVVGVGTPTNPLIGPTPYLHSKLPIEGSTAEFEHLDSSSATWTEAFYESFLPPSWRNFPPIKEAWLAGRAGRDDILAHGTVVNPAYYAGASYFPGTPSAGCMVSNEDWDPATGRLLSSGQLTLAQTFARAGGREQVWGYLVVVDLGPGDGPVTRDEVAPLVSAAERLR
jgi:hypothetical protein